MLISVIIPTYNRAHLLSRAIDSVLSQTFQDFELIIVDDGSTDNTKEIVEEYQKKDERIKYLWEENSGGPAKPKNTGIKNSQGEFIAFLDSDDEWLPEKLEKQLKLFENSNNLGFVSCNALIIDENNNIKGEYQSPRNKSFINLLDGNKISNCGVIVKKNIFEELGIFDENLKFGEDWEMWLRIAKKYNFDSVYESLIKCYLHQNNITKTIENFKQIEDFKYILEKYKDDFKKYPKVKSRPLRNIGTFYILDNNSKMARKYFEKAIKVSPLSLRLYFQYFLSFFPNIYKKLFFIKRYKF
ncbi:MAG: glycosyltransferase [Candidatus Pacebacteria bacterium]|nr:glycosyltransferase [Candidatus Paceibacterota bacterium]